MVSLGTFPHVFLELSDTEVAEYFKPSDLMIGKTVNIYGRNFLLYDCDMFTKTFYAKNFGVSSFEPIDRQTARNEFPRMVRFRSWKEGIYCDCCRKFHRIMALAPWKIPCRIVYVFNQNGRKKITSNSWKTIISYFATKQF